MPVSEKRLAANRANALKSTGPRTPEGKARSARNSLRHGLYARKVALPEYWELLAAPFAERAARDYAADPGLAILVAQRTLLRVHRSYAISLVTRFHSEMFAAPDPRAYRQEHTCRFLAALRYYGRIRRRIRALERALFPALLEFHRSLDARPAPQALAAPQRNCVDSNPIDTPSAITPVSLAPGRLPETAAREQENTSNQTQPAPLPAEAAMGTARVGSAAHPRGTESETG